MLAPLKPNVISLQKQHIRGYGIRFFILTGLQTDFLCKFAARSYEKSVIYWK